MTIIVNNESRQIDPHTTLYTLLQAEGLTGKGGVAVAINGKLAPKTNWPGTLLKDGDELMIINAAYGG